jgi:hypothetical protein
MTVSMVKRCHQTETHPITFDEIWSVIRSGDHDLKERIIQIRNNYEAEKDIFAGDAQKAKKAIADLKLQLPAFLPSGSFSKRENGSLVEYSGILCADMDSLGADLPTVRDFFKSSPFVRAIATSPSGDGLKVFFNVINDPARHEDSFRAIKQYVLEWTGIEIDDKCKDLARLCFFTYDQDLWVRLDGNEIIQPADPLPRGRTLQNSTIGLQNSTILTSADVNSMAREQIAFRLLGELVPAPEKGGYFVHCPGESFHTNKTGEKHTILYLNGAPNISCQHESCAHVIESFNKVLQSEIGKAENQDRRASHIPYRDMRHATFLANPNGEKPLTPEKPLIEICTIEELENYVAPPGIVLIGDYHITQDTGFVFVIGGHPSVGKSLSAISLAVAGTKGEGEWFGLKVHRKFKVLIIQTENGPFRLSRIIKELGCKELRDHLQITKPPPYGLLFRRDDFRIQVAEIVQKFSPDIVIIDPWNSVARDQEQVTYLETFQIIRSVLPPDTILGILAHTRKPQKDERASGRSLMHVLAGSHVLSSVPRTIFIMQHASDDVEEDTVVVTCCKNNDGEPGKRTAHRRRPSGIFEPVANFDWAEFDSSDKDKRVLITQEMVAETFESGPMLLPQARDRLQELSGATKSSCYRALSEKGRFGDDLEFNGKLVNWRRK